MSNGHIDPGMRALRVLAARQAALATEGFSDPYAYAFLHGVYPVRHEGDQPNPFEGGYTIPRNFVERVLNAVNRELSRTWPAPPILVPVVMRVQTS